MSNFARDEPHAYRVAFELGQPDAREYPELLKQQLRAWQTIRGAVQYAYDSHALEADPETVSHLYWAALHGLAGLALLGHLRLRSLETLTGPMIDMLLRGTQVAAPGKNALGDRGAEFPIETRTKQETSG